MEMRQANKSMQKSGIKMQTGLHYDISQVTNEHFEAESQAVGFPVVLRMFQLNGNFLVICRHLDLTHSSFSSPHMYYAPFHVYMPAHGFIYIHTNVPLYSWHTLVILSQEKSILATK